MTRIFTRLLDDDFCMNEFHNFWSQCCDCGGNGCGCSGCGSCNQCPDCSREMDEGLFFD